MQQLTEREKKRIQRYCMYPKIAATALIMSFVACLLMLPLQMINDIAFHQKEFQPAGIYTAIALTVIELAIFCYCALAPRFGMQGKQWKELQGRLAVAQTNKDRSAEVAGVLATQAAGRLLKNSDNDLARIRCDDSKRQEADHSSRGVARHCAAWRLHPAVCPGK